MAKPLAAGVRETTAAPGDVPQAVAPGEAPQAPASGEVLAAAEPGEAPAAAGIGIACASDAVPAAAASAPGEASERTYLCIDLKSFYASVECAERGLDPFATNLVVADPDRSKNTICLAITPAMKALGVKNRCRVRDIPEGIDYITAVPRMRLYLRTSNKINRIYQQFVSEIDMHVYSIDECFIDATPYLRLYRTDARAFALRLMSAVFEQTHITATAGIGPNMFLSKVALDIAAKHAPDGIGILDDAAFKREIWFHRPITDIWGIGGGIARRLAKHGAYDLAGVCALPHKVIRDEFGLNGEYLLDHAWGLEPCTVAQARGYKPRGHSIDSGQVLMRDYSFAEAETVLREMALASALELVEGGLAASSIGVYAGYSNSNFAHQNWELGFWCAPHMSGGGTRKLAKPDNTPRHLIEAVVSLFHETVDPHLSIRRLSVSYAGLMPKDEVQPTLFDEHADQEKQDAIADAMVSVRSRFGANAMLMGTSLKQEANARERNRQIGGHRA